MPDNKALQLIRKAMSEEARHDKVSHMAPYAEFKTSLNTYIAAVAAVGEYYGFTDYTPHSWEELLERAQNAR